MKDKILLVILFAFTSRQCNAQFEHKVSDLQVHYRQEVPIYSLGYFEADSFRLHKIILPDSINLDTPKAIFYLILTVNDTISYYQSSGGRNNFLWTLNDIERKVDGSRTHFLIKATWNRWDYKSRVDGEYYIIGEFSLSPAVGKKHRKGDNGFAFELRKRRG